MKTVFIWTVMSLTAISAFADDFGNYSQSCAREDITISVPQNFNIIDKNPSTEWNLVINPTYTSPYSAPMPMGWIYPVALEAANSDCALLYPFIMPGAPETDGPWVGLGNIVADEIHASRNAPDFDIKKDMTIITLPDMSQHAMADTVAIYPLHLQEPFMGKYNNCYGVYLRKYAHPAMLFKVLLTDESLPRKEQYIKQLLGTVKYGDKVTPAGEAMESSQFNRGLLDPQPRNHWKPGIVK